LCSLLPLQPRVVQADAPAVSVTYAQKNLSTEPATAEQDARLPHPHGNQERPRGAGAPRGANGLLSPPGTATSKEFSARGGSWPGSRRLLRRVDFLAVYDSGMRRGSPHFTIFGRLRAA